MKLDRNIDRWAACHQGARRAALSRRLLHVAVAARFARRTLCTGQVAKWNVSLLGDATITPANETVCTTIETAKPRAAHGTVGAVYGPAVVLLCGFAKR